MSTPVSTTIGMRPYADEADLSAIVELLNVCETVDQVGNSTSVDELRRNFADPEWDLGRDLCLWQDESGRLFGFAAIWKRVADDHTSGHLWFNVHPEVRETGLEDQILTWAEQRMREVSRELGVTVQLRANARANHEYRVALLERYGFTSVRTFYRMTRSLSESLAEPSFPQGFTLRHVEAERDAVVWVEMFNASFIDHWDHQPMTIERFKRSRTKADYNPEFDLIAVAPNGTFAAFCRAAIHPEDNARTGRNEGWINVLGTRRGFRKLGLGRAMLLSGLQVLKTAKMESALLGVDAENPSGALRLYESVGFTQLLASIVYGKEVRDEG
ncbi:MAG: GNAT family N-acetyltransferase [Leptolyngbya sp. BL-A-14]